VPQISNLLAKISAIGKKRQTLKVNQQPSPLASTLLSQHQLPAGDRPGSEISTISVAELNSVTVHPNEDGFQTGSQVNSLPALMSTTSSAQLQSPIASVPVTENFPSQGQKNATTVQPQYHRPHPHIDYSQMFQISITPTTISTNPDDL
jgi:hypothetical protein